jgi:hypothetical protein
MPGGTLAPPVDTMICSGPLRNKAREHDAAIVFYLKLKQDPKFPVREAPLIEQFSSELAELRIV